MSAHHLLQRQRCIHDVLSSPANANLVAEAISFEHRLYSCGLLVPHNQRLRSLFCPFQPSQLRKFSPAVTPEHPFDNNACYTKFRPSLRFSSVLEVLAFRSLVTRSFARFGAAEQRLINCYGLMMSNMT
jgi:hypothetical protein